VFIELVDVLRCPNPHEETWLVLAAEQMNERDAIEGTLGCPICHAEYRIVGGVAHFDRGAHRQPRSESHDENEAIRLAALLDLTDARGYAILVGDTGIHAPGLRDHTDVQLLLVNPPPGIAMGGGLSGLTSAPASSLPLAAASARGIALDAAATPQQLDAALGVVSAGGRIVAPIALPVPRGVTELARDDRHWVAERSSAPIASGFVKLHRRE